MPTLEHTSMIQRWFTEIFEQGNLSTVDELVAVDFVAHAQGGDPATKGREAFKTWLHWYRTNFTDQRWMVEDILSDGEKAVARYRGHTTYRGGLFDLPSTNQCILETGIIIYRIVDGQVQEIWSEMSDLQVVFQLGALLVPSQVETAST